MGFKEIPAVPCLPVCCVDVACLAVVDDMHPQLPDFLHPYLYLFDVGKQIIRLRCRFLCKTLQLLIIVDIVLLQKQQNFCHLLQVKDLCPALITSSLALLNLFLQINQQVNPLAFDGCMLHRSSLLCVLQDLYQILCPEAHMQRIKADESFLCPALYSDVFSALNLVSFLTEQVQKCLQIFRFLLQNLCDHGF